MLRHFKKGTKGLERFICMLCMQRCRNAFKEDVKGIEARAVQMRCQKLQLGEGSSSKECSQTVLNFTHRKLLLPTIFLKITKLIMFPGCHYNSYKVALLALSMMPLD